MKQVLIIIFFYSCLLSSCYKPYEPGIKANDTILIVDGLITNDIAAYHVRLSRALPFNSTKSETRVSSAIVSVTDNLGNSFKFLEKKPGDYVSDSLSFTATQGRTYILSIETPDGEKFISGPQKIETAYSPDTVYAVLEYKQSITRFNQIVKTVRGTDIMIDISSQSDVLPMFRISSSVVKQYFYTLNIPPPNIYPPLYLFYCWQTENSNTDINLVDNDYSSKSKTISRHSVYFLDEQIKVEGLVYGLGPKQPDQSYIGVPMSYRDVFSVSRRILYLNQYSLNNESYQYYKSIDELLKSEGKLFDPIASQLKGNISCITDPGKKVFGFFESSSVTHSAYSISYRNSINNYTIIQRPFILPRLLNGCLINKPPPFWIP